LQRLPPYPEESTNIIAIIYMYAEKKKTMGNNSFKIFVVDDV